MNWIRKRCGVKGRAHQKKKLQSPPLYRTMSHLVALVALVATLFFSDENIFASLIVLRKQVDMMLTVLVVWE
jgi:hypothetical protein